jgi:hypothetical protein
MIMPLGRGCKLFGVVVAYAAMEDLIAAITKWLFDATNHGVTTVPAVASWIAVDNRREAGGRCPSRSRKSQR